MFDDKSFDNLPGHWVLARLGKRVLRPGGMEMTRGLLQRLAISPQDDLVEFAPGLGATARLATSRGFRSYVGIEQNAEAARGLQNTFRKEVRMEIRTGDAQDPPVESRHASVLWGEAIMTMQPTEVKRRMIGQAARILRPGGRYAIHEIALDERVPDEERTRVYKDLGAQVRMPVRPLTAAEWRSILEQEGFEVLEETRLPMHLLEPRRMIADEGLLRTLKIVAGVVADPKARKRVLGMRRVFRKHRHSMFAIGFVCRRRAEALA